jgi:hypothetical protein
MNVYDVEYSVVDKPAHDKPHRVVSEGQHLMVLAGSSDEAAAYVRAKYSDPNHDVWNGFPLEVARDVEFAANQPRSLSLHRWCRVA